MTDEAIILAGGLGTRLKEITKKIPKPLVDINGKPFIDYLLRYLSKYELRNIILSVGYKADMIIDYIGKERYGLSIDYSLEKEPLGTGGAILKSLEKVQKKDVFILNGDTFFSIDLNQLKSFHENRHADLTIALKKLENTQRYGTVNIDKQQEITGFIEKKEGIEGYINGGIYILNKSWFHSLNFEEDFFSFETEILQKKYQQSQFYGLAFDDYFIDIGIPEDYEKAKVDFKKYISKSYYTQ